MHVLTLQQCPVAQVRVNDLAHDVGFSARCAAHLAWAVRQVKGINPDLVIASNSMNASERLTDGATGNAAVLEWSAGVRALMSSVSQRAERTVVLDPPLLWASLTKRYTKLSRPADCISHVLHGYNVFVEATNTGTAASAVEHVRTAPWFCSFSTCPSFVGKRVVFADGEHLTRDYSLRLTPVLRDALLG